MSAGCATAPAGGRCLRSLLGTVTGLAVAGAVFSPCPHHRRAGIGATCAPTSRPSCSGSWSSSRPVTATTSCRRSCSARRPRAGLDRRVTSTSSSSSVGCLGGAPNAVPCCGHSSRRRGRHSGRPRPWSCSRPRRLGSGGRVRRPGRARPAPVSGAPAGRGPDLAGRAACPERERLRGLATEPPRRSTRSRRRECCSRTRVSLRATPPARRGGR